MLDHLTALGDRVIWVRGNADCELVSLARGETTAIPDPIAPSAARQLSDHDVALLAELPHPVTVEVYGFGAVLFCHGTPRDDEEVVLVDTGLPRSEAALTGVDPQVANVVCGHTHMPLQRLAHRRLIVNLGSRGHAVRPTGRALGTPERRGRPAAHDELRHRGGVRHDRRRRVSGRPVVGGRLIRSAAGDAHAPTTFAPGDGRDTEAGPR